MMQNKMNNAIYSVKRSAIREFNRMARETPGCISLTLGEPDFDTPTPIREAAKLALDLGETHYIDNNGSIDLRNAIAEFERNKNGMDYTADEIILTIGATEALFTAIFGILNPGDEIIVPTPAFVLYESIVGVCRGKFVPLPTENNDFQISREMLENAVTPRTKAIILNSPNNPTGSFYSQESLSAVHDVVSDKEIFVICDDVYRQLVYTEGYHSFSEYRDLRDRIIVVQSFSKPYAMTGWRMGYLMADLPVKRELEKIHQFSVVSTASTAQRACIAALNCDPAPMLDIYRKRRDYALHRLQKMGLEVHRPEGAFYLFPSIEKFGLSSSEFCTRMIREAGLAATPGICFGSDKHIRLTYCYSDAQLEEGLNRLEGFIHSLEKSPCKESCQ